MTRSASRQRPEPTSSWLVALLIAVTATCTFLVFVPFWTGISGLPWSNDHAWPLTYVGGVALVVWFGCVWVNVKVVVWPRPTGNAANGARRRGTLLHAVLSTTFVFGVAFMQVSLPAAFFVDMVAGTGAEIYSGWIVAALVVPTAAAILWAAFFTHPRFLTTDATCDFHAVMPSEI